MPEPKWGIVSTIKAPTADILEFAAYHLEAGAHRLYLYLDAPHPEALPYLKAHPKIRVFECTDASWDKRRKEGKPAKHQVRQVLNATRAYARQARDVDWLAHIDVDEFISSPSPLAQVLGSLPMDAKSARIRPLELLAGSRTRFKAAPPAAPGQEQVLAEVYPTYGNRLKGGFLSHVQGKLVVRTGMDNITYRIHRVFHDDTPDIDQVELDGVDLCHFHATSWDSWNSHLAYRHDRGSYRPDLSPNKPVAQGGIRIHDLLADIRSADGQDGLRTFFQEVCADGPDLRARLAKHGLLKKIDLQLDKKRRKHFPAFG